MSINSPSFLSCVFQRTCRGSSFGEFTRFRRWELWVCLYISNKNTSYELQIPDFAITLWLSATWWDWKWKSNRHAIRSALEPHNLDRISCSYLGGTQIPSEENARCHISIHLDDSEVHMLADRIRKAMSTAKREVDPSSSPEIKPIAASSAKWFLYVSHMVTELI